MAVELWTCQLGIGRGSEQSVPRSVSRFGDKQPKVDESQPSILWLHVAPPTLLSGARTPALLIWWEGTERGACATQLSN